MSMSWRCGILGRTLVFFSLGVALLLSQSLDAFGQKKHPAEEKGIARSIKSEVETSIEFVNNSQQTIKVFWLNLEGKRELLHVLLPGDRETQKTFLNHPWLLTDQKDNALGIYYPDTDKRVVSFGNAANQPFGKAGKGGFKGGGFGTPVVTSPKLTYLQDAIAVADLKLTAEQIGKVKELAAKQREAAQALVGLAAAARLPKTAALREEADKAIATILTGVQARRLEQIVRQELGVGLFTDQALVGVLQLNAEQQVKFGAAQAQYSLLAKDAKKAGPTGSPEYIKQIVLARKTSYDATTAFLNADQKKSWQEMVGEPFQGFVRVSIFTGFDPGPFGNPAGEPVSARTAQRSSAFTVGKSSASNHRLLTEKSVQDALKLTEEQLKTLASAGAAATPLTPAQLQQYIGIHLQVIMRTYGPAGVFRYRDGIHPLGLTADQQVKLQVIGQDDSQAFAALPAPRKDEAVQALDKQTEAKLQEVLTADQRTKLKDLLGEPFKGAVQDPVGGLLGKGPVGTSKGKKGGPATGVLRAGAYVLSNWSIDSHFLAEKSVQDELQLSDGQRKMIPATGSLKPTLVNEVLDPRQFRRYQGIYLQASSLTWGPAGTFRYRDVLNLLNLNDEQKAKVLAIGEEDRQGFAALPTPRADEAVQALNKTTEAKLLEVLSGDQRTKLKDLIGEPFKGTIENPLGGAVVKTVPKADAQLLFQQAQGHENDKNYGLALKCIADAIAIAPENDAYLAHASHVERFMGRHADGVKHALQAIKLNPKVEWYYASVAFNAHANRDLALAREYCQKVIEFGPERVGQGNYDLAKKLLAE